MDDFSKKLAGGVASGWLTGAVILRVGKTVALVAGGGILLLQVAHYKGYINVDWASLLGRAEEQTQQIESSVQDITPHIVKKVKDVAQKNKVFTGGFVGGFFLGLAMMYFV